MHLPTDPPARWRPWLVIAIAVAAGLVAVGLRLYFVLHAQVLQPVDQQFVRGDAVQYYRYAWNLVHRGTFSSAWSGASVASPDSFRDPGYPAFLAVIQAATGSFDAFYGVTLIAQAILGGLTVVLLVVAARRALPVGWLAFAALLMAIWPHSVAMPAYLLSETLLGFLCAVAVCLYTWATSRRTVFAWVITGLAFSAAAMTNAVLLPFGAVLALIAAWRRDINGRMARALLIASLALPAAWGVRSLTLPPSPSATGRAVTNLVQGSWPSYHLAFQLASHGDANARAQLDEMQAEMDLLQAHPADGARLVLRRLAEAPAAYLGWYVSKPALLWDWNIRIGQGDIYVYPTRDSPFKTSPAFAALEGICFVLNPILMVLALFASLLAVGRRSVPPEVRAMAGLALFITLVYGALQSEPRYAIPFRGLEMLLGAAAIPMGLAWWRSLRIRDGHQGS